MHITKNKRRRGADNMWVKYVSVKGHQRNQKAVALKPEYIRITWELVKPQPAGPTPRTSDAAGLGRAQEFA